MRAFPAFDFQSPVVLDGWVLLTAAMPEAAASEHLICICPICRTRFRASDDLLKVAGGQVRCGACLVVFNGHDHQVPQTPSNDRRPAVEDAAGGALDVPAAEATAAPPSSTAADGPQTRMAGQLAMAIGILALAALLVVNVFWLRWESWSRQPALRGIYASACSVVGCELPRLRAVADVELTSHGFQPRRGPPRGAGAGPKNCAMERPFAQPFPTLLARLLDARGTVLATHRLAAKDYLEAAATKPFAPGHKVSIVLRFDDPGVAAVAYSLSLL